MSYLVTKFKKVARPFFTPKRMAHGAIASKGRTKRKTERRCIFRALSNVQFQEPNCCQDGNSPLLKSGLQAQLASCESQLFLPEKIGNQQHPGVSFSC
jgi:hypothetical protein